MTLYCSQGQKKSSENCVNYADSVKFFNLENWLNLDLNCSWFLVM